MRALSASKRGSLAFSSLSSRQRAWLLSLTSKPGSALLGAGAPGADSTRRSDTLAKRSLRSGPLEERGKEAAGVVEMERERSGEVAGRKADQAAVCGRWRLLADRRVRESARQVDMRLKE